jgi:two-component system CheB/CheR fusion protein
VNDNSSLSRPAQPACGQDTGSCNNAGVPSYIVGLGASAGGLESLEKFFMQMPADSGMAFVVIQHLSPDFKTMMDELLARRTSMSIRLAQNDMPVQPDAVYLLPPKKDMIIAEGRLLLTDRENTQELSLPIDHFFRSLAQDAGRRAIAIVLSGTGSDGSRGIGYIKNAGGLVLCEDPQAAKFDGMPKSAIKAGFVDAVSTPDNLPQLLLDHQRRLVPGDSVQQAVKPVLAGIEEIFDLLRVEYDIDFSHYKPATVTRRIERRLAITESSGLAAYIGWLREDPAELHALYKDLLIGVTRFFRDREYFDVLERECLPKLLGNTGNEGPIRIWVAGCATGEEAYSLAILLHERIGLLKRKLDVKIFATDVHRASLEYASAGVYHEDQLADVPARRLARYFEKKNNGYHVVPELRQIVLFAPHNVIKDAPFTRLDLISCRNLLIYLEPHYQKKVLSLFHFGLKRGGVLFLGPSESPGTLKTEFDVLNEHCKIYQKSRDVRLPADLRLSAPGRYSGPKPVFSRNPVAATQGSPLLDILSPRDREQFVSDVEEFVYAYRRD